VHVALVITDADWYESIGYAAAWTAALEAEGCSVERLEGMPAHWPSQGPEPGRYDLAIAHVLTEEVEAFAPTMKVAAVLEAVGVPLLNPVAALVASSDKLVTHAVWAAARLPQPAAWDLADLDGKAAWPCPGRPMVLKPSLGDGARHIELVHDLAEARAMAEAWRGWTDRDGKPRGAAVLQEWVADPRCIRLFATPDEVSVAYGKARDTGALITNGKYAEVFEPPAELARLARRMVATLGGGLMGVDVLVDGDGRLLALEANAPFGFEVGDPAQGRWVAQAALQVAQRRRPAA
jgi:glutathione synthase/RimK-type ligase-like ATP-grasp enzyme